MSNVQPWDPGLVYNILDLVSYKGDIYEAQSSIAGDIPDKPHSSWKRLEKAAEEIVQTPVAPIEIKSEIDDKTLLKQDELIVKEVAQNYSFKRFKANNSDVKAIENNLLLVTKGPYETKLSWKSSDPSVIATSGKVTVPECGDDYPVVLFLTVAKGSFSMQREFVVWVKSKAICLTLSDKASVNEAYHQLSMEKVLANNPSHREVTSALNLPSQAAYDCKVAWLCFQSTLINSKGDVTPSNEPKDVSIYAIISKGNEKVCKTFSFTVIPQR
jgi:hypothetical protein